MRNMISFDRGGSRFIHRVAGMAFAGDRVLLHRAETDDFLALPGGRVEMLETAQESLVREMQEELNVGVAVDRLVWVVENFFEYEERRCHELAFYYVMYLPAGCYLLTEPGPFTATEENGVRLFFHWQPLAGLADASLYPTFLREGLLSLPPTLEHIVHRDS